MKVTERTGVPLSVIYDVINKFNIGIIAKQKTAKKVQIKKYVRVVMRSIGRIRNTSIVHEQSAQESDDSRETLFLKLW